MNIFKNISTIVVEYSKSTLTVIFCITLCSLYIAFLSDKKLYVDFSLEQMFSENDPERDLYINFQREFSREDDKILIAYRYDNLLNINSLDRLSDLSYEIHLVINDL